MCEVIEFPTALRAAQIAAERCHKFGYGLVTTQSSQKRAIDWCRMTGVSAYEAACRVVRGPNEPIFGGYAA
jgi:hypothetical protein